MTTANAATAFLGKSTRHPRRARMFTGDLSGTESPFSNIDTQFAFRRVVRVG
jgi:hypothetical protein